MIKAKNISVFYKTGLLKKTKALDGFNISMEKGDVFGLLGPNGAGKSTAMYCFLGLIKPDKGEIRIMGDSITPGSQLFKKIAYLPEEAHYHLYLTVEEAIKYYGALYNLEISLSRQNELLERFGLWEFRKVKLSHCSKGMKQKVGIVQALLNEKTELMFLDEPTRGLDPSTTKDFRDYLLEINRTGTTVVLNSHILSEVEMVCNKVAIMNNGKVLIQDNLKNLVRVENDIYEVEFELDAEFPACITQPVKTATTVKGFLEGKDLSSFLSYIHTKQLKLYQCSLKRISLEEVFSKVIDTKDENERTALSKH